MRQACSARPELRTRKSWEPTIGKFLKSRMKTDMIKVMHIITTLGPAGAENMLCRIAAGMGRSRFENEIVSLTGILDLAEKKQSIGVPVRTLRMKKAVPNPL